MEHEFQNVASLFGASESSSPSRDPEGSEARSNVSLPVLVEQAINQARARAEARDIVVQPKHDTRQRLLQVNEDQLRRAIIHLLLNGIKYAESNRPLVIWTYFNPAFVEIGVRNAGGYPPSVNPRYSGVRESNASPPRLHAIGSLGLDMALAKHFVERQGGRVELRASARHGAPASMVIRLPEDVALPLAAIPSRGNGTTQSSQRTRLDGTHVLLVEDDPDALEFLTLVLRSTGARVSAYTYTAPAYSFFVNAAAEDRPDVIVSDIAMPMEDGYSFLRRMRNWEASQAVLPVPAIAVTAFSREEDCRRALVSGFDRHVAKPLDASCLVDTIAQWS